MFQNRVLITAEAIRKRNDREKRRNKLMSTISLVYLVIWLPLGILGTLSDMKVNLFGTNPETPTIIFMGCNLDVYVVPLWCRKHPSFSKIEKVLCKIFDTNTILWMWWNPVSVLSPITIYLTTLSVDLQYVIYITVEKLC